MSPSRWWSRSRGLPAETYTDWAASLTAAPGRAARVLAWARTPGGVVIGSPAALSFVAETSSTSDHGWRHVGWHDIEHGGWDADTASLSWVTYDAERGALALAEPGRVPELFRERVAASIVVERFVPVPGSRPDSERGVVVNGRRNLADVDEPIRWHASLGRGASWRLPGLREAADQAVAALRAEYDPGGLG